jgi:hypothetical protein
MDPVACAAEGAAGPTRLSLWPVFRRLPIPVPFIFRKFLKKNIFVFILLPLNPDPQKPLNPDPLRIRIQSPGFKHLMDRKPGP